jgi:hypothetical protein
LKVYDELKVNALTLERVLRDIYRVELPHNRIHMILKELVERWLSPASREDANGSATSESIA